MGALGTKSGRAQPDVSPRISLESIRIWDLLLLLSNTRISAGVYAFKVRIFGCTEL